MYAWGARRRRSLPAPAPAPALALALVLVAIALAGCGNLLTLEDDPAPPPPPATPPSGADGGVGTICECPPPSVCAADDPRTCTCATRRTCTEAQATCGEIDDGCGGTLPCGVCEGATSCNAIPASGTTGFACSLSSCVPDNLATCAGRCGRVTNNCGAAIACNDCGDRLCGGGANATTCGCPPRPSTLLQHVVNGHRCYQTETHGGKCGGTPEGPVGSLHLAAFPGLVPLYRCFHDFGSSTFGFLLTTNSAECTGSPWTFEGPLGRCSPAPVCGSRPLRRFVNRRTGDVITTTGAGPIADYIDNGVVCHVWP